MNEVKEIINSYNEYLSKIPTGSIYIAECLRVDQLPEAFRSIKDFSEGVNWLATVAELLRKNNSEVVLNIEQLNDFLLEINDGLEKQDYVLVADLFEYEIVPFFEEVPLIERIS